MKKTAPLLSLVALSFAMNLPSRAVAETGEINDAYLALFKPLPEVAASSSNEVTDAKVDLGHKLFFDKRFSINQEMNCTSCHNLEAGGVDGLKTSTGHDGSKGDRNAPSVLNASLNIAQFWDGRARDVEEQAKGPVLNPIEMGMPDADYVVDVIKTIPGYADLFAKAFPGEDDPINYDNFGRAIGAFERKLLTPGRWDEFLEGKKDALTPEEKAGFNTFVGVGCAACHNGPAVGGAMYQKLGLVEPWPELEDVGRGKVTGNEGENHFFKVPNLRNITQTAPYLHDGSVTSLREMVRLMAKHQLGKELGTDEIKSITSFLQALEGEAPKELVQEPELPANGPDTPGPKQAS